jgi:hypothetical protein
LAGERLLGGVLGCLEGLQGPCRPVGGILGRALTRFVEEDDGVGTGELAKRRGNIPVPYGPSCSLTCFIT